MMPSLTTSSQSQEDLPRLVTTSGGNSFPVTSRGGAITTNSTGPLGMSLMSDVAVSAVVLVRGNLSMERRISPTLRNEEGKRDLGIQVTLLTLHHSLT